jgi:hypothetical protein
MGDFDDAIAILQRYQLEAEAMCVAYDNSEDLHTSEGLGKAIDILRRSKKSDIIPLEQAVQQAIKHVEEIEDVVLIWDGFSFEVAE